MDTTQELAAKTALNKMMKDGYFSICVIDNIVKMGNILPNRRAYDILHTLHCVHFKDMPTELYEQLPTLIRECLNCQIVYEFETLRQQTITISPAKRFLKFVNG